jgi:hypothetical protein
VFFDCLRGGEEDEKEVEVGGHARNIDKELT